MKPKNLFSTVNWRHAAGELILIVTGILVALAISDWNDRRIERIQELALLEEIQSALVADLESLQSRLAEFSAAAGRIEQLTGLLEEKPPYDPMMDALFGAVYGVRVTNLNTAPYETLKSVGLQFISNRELRSHVAKIYDLYYERLLNEHQIDISINIDLMRSYFLKHFRDLVFWKSATPIDYDTVINDIWFQNMVDYRLAALRSNQLDSYALTISEIQYVLALLERELAG
jgi:hypothetical protein